MSQKKSVIAPSKTKTPLMKAARRLTTYSNEFIKVVPLHAPKPTLSIDGSTANRATTDADLFAGKMPAASASPPQLVYFGGPLLTNAQVYNVFWGKKWSAGAGAAIAKRLNDFFKAILVSPLIDQLAEYNVAGKSIGHGSLIGSKVITVGAPVGSVTDTTIRTQLQRWISARTVAATTPNTLYFVYLDPGVASIMGGSKSCSSYCGYHDAVGKVYYAVMPYPSCTLTIGRILAANWSASSSRRSSWLPCSAPSSAPDCRS
jgi:hypothetical protein